MPRNIPHKWLLHIQSGAQSTFDNLQSGEKRGIIRRLQELLNAADPNTLPFVERLKANKFERMRKFRAGNFRVFFVLQPTEITHQGHIYKGTFFLLAIRNRRDAY